MRSSSTRRRIAHNSFILILLVVVALLLQVTNAQVQPVNAKNLIAFFNEQFSNITMRKEGYVGLVVEVVNKEKILWSQGIGWIDAEVKPRTGPPTVNGSTFALGPLSKTFTTLVAFWYIDKGRLSLSTPVNEILERYKQPFRITDYVEGNAGDSWGGFFPRAPHTRELTINDLIVNTLSLIHI